MPGPGEIWLTMDVGDINGDGRDDIVLGSFAPMDGQGDRRGITARWRQPDAPTILILENTGKHTGGSVAARSQSHAPWTAGRRSPAGRSACGNA